MANVTVIEKVRMIKGFKVFDSEEDMNKRGCKNFKFFPEDDRCEMNTYAGTTKFIKEGSFKVSEYHSHDGYFTSLDKDEVIEYEEKKKAERHEAYAIARKYEGVWLLDSSRVRCEKSKLETPNTEIIDKAFEHYDNLGLYKVNGLVKSEGACGGKLLHMGSVFIQISSYEEGKVTCYSETENPLIFTEELAEGKLKPISEEELAYLQKRYIERENQKYADKIAEQRENIKVAKRNIKYWSRRYMATKTVFEERMKSNTVNTIGRNYIQYNWDGSKKETEGKTTE